MYRFLRFHIAIILSCSFFVPVKGDESPAYEELSVNNIRASVHADGLFFTDQNYVPVNSVFEVPRGSGNSTIYASSLWLSGLDDRGNLYTAAQTYRQRGVDFHPGPVEELGHASDTSDWNNLWKIDQATIKAHQQNWQKDDYEIPEVVAKWPAHIDGPGSRVIAPFMDRQQNTIYEPENGDYPFIYGDEAIYFIYNDQADYNEETSSPSLGMEIKGMAYAYNKPESHPLGNTIFLSLNVTNRSNTTYHDFIAGLWTDLQIGEHFNDYFGTDPGRNMYYGYIGNEEDSEYGFSPPAQGVVFLNQEPGTMVSYDNNEGERGNPQIRDHYRHYMEGKMKEGENFPYENENFLYDGDPCADEGFYEHAAGNPMGDRRGLGSLDGQTLEPGDNISIDIAFIYARSDDGHLQSVCELQNAADDVHKFYRNNINPEEAVSIIEQPGEENSISFYPNPANDLLNIQTPERLTGEINVTFYDLQGREIEQKVFSRDNQIDLNFLESGTYILKTQWEGNTERHRIVVER